MQNQKECYCEEWKPIPGYNGRYEISSIGRVRSTDFVIVQMSRYGHVVKRTIKGNFRTPTDNGNGYLFVSLVYSNAIRKNHYIHRLVADAFCEKKDGCDYVNHLDYDKKNNRATNLEWTTQLDNVNHSRVNMCKPKTAPATSATGEKYIYHRGSRFRLSISGKIDKQFLTFDEARAAKKVILGV